DVPHSYKLKPYRRWRPWSQRALPKGGTLTFTNVEGAENIPLPNPVLQHCHFRIAEVLNASGMSEFR
ncbi:uncharacterized protein P174DRAFT_364188, partial [Aspergillus novofumigatus IBT 16806]